MTEKENQLTEQLALVLSELKKQSLIIQKQQHHIDQLLRQLYGKKSEKLPAQPSSFDQSLFAEGEL